MEEFSKKNENQQIKGKQKKKKKKLFNYNNNKLKFSHEIWIAQNTLRNCSIKLKSIWCWVVKFIQQTSPKLEWYSMLRSR